MRGFFQGLGKIAASIMGGLVFALFPEKARRNIIHLSAIGEIHEALASVILLQLFFSESSHLSTLDIYFD